MNIITLSLSYDPIVLQHEEEGTFNLFGTFIEQDPEFVEF
jgi:hypothetical protein